MGGAQNIDSNKPYYEWSTTSWDFGMPDQYPVLKYADDPRTITNECRIEGDTQEEFPICDSFSSQVQGRCAFVVAKEFAVCGSLLSPDLDMV